MILKLRIPTYSKVTINLLFLILTLKAIATRGQESAMRFATQPTHQTAVLGSTVVLPCRVVNRAGTVQWTRDGFGLGTIRRLKGFDRYSMIGSDEEGDFSLRISTVTLEDDAEYQCQVSSSGGPKLRSRTARLTVFVPPKPPSISPSPTVHATAGVNVTIKCQSVGGRPAPEMQWLDDAAGLELRSGIVYAEDLMEDQLRVRASSTITFTPTRLHHGRTLTCLTHNPALNEPLAARITLTVEYPPEVELILEPNELSEGNEARVTCRAEANPSDVTYKWLRHGQEVSDAKGPTLNLGVLTRGDHGTPIACEATNAVGTIRRTQALNIRYAPRFETAPGSESAEPGSDVVLRCKVDGNPPPEITWHHIETNTIVGQGPELPIKAAKDTAGTYICVAVSRGFSPLEGRLHLRLRGPPVISVSKSVAARKGQTAELKCEATAVPHPLAVTWMKDGATINPDSHGRVIISEKQRADGVLSLLRINATLDQDFATYNCSVVNEYGIDVQQITLRRQTVIPVVVIVGGGVGVIFIVIVIIIFIICSRRFKPNVDKKSVEAGHGTGSTLNYGHKEDSKNDIMKNDVMIVPTILKSDVTMLSIRPSVDLRTSDNDSDTKEPDNRTSSSLSATDRESDHWDGSEKGMVGSHHTLPHSRYSQAPVFTPPREHSYLSYLDYTRDYSPIQVGESYAQFKLIGPYARSSPASDPPSSLPSSVAPPPYSPTPNGMMTGVNGSINGLTSRNCTPNGRIPNGLTTLNGSLRHDLIADLQQPDLTREVSHLGGHQEIPLKDQQHLSTTTSIGGGGDPSTAMHTKFILPPQANMTPGTLV